MKLKKAVPLVPLFLLAVLSSGCSTRISPGYVGIEVDQSGTQRGVQDFPLKTGRIWYNPYSTSVIEFPTFVQTAVWTQNPNEGHKNQNEELTFTILGSMVVSIDVALSYHLVDQKVPAFYVKFRTDDLDQFTHGFLRNVARDCFNEHGGAFNIEQVMGDNGPFIKAARQCTQAQVEPYGVVLDQFGLIGAPRPPDSVIAAINLKIQAQQIAQQKDNEVKQAEADAHKQVARAEGEAKSKVAIATGEAEANRKLSESLSSPLLEWRRLSVTERAIERWHGDIPGTLVNGGGQDRLLFNIPAGNRTQGQ